MFRSVKLFEKLNWLAESVWFFKAHFFVIFGLGLVAAFGRAIQLEALGPVTPFSHILLEIVIESARVLIFLYTLGLTNFKTGSARIVRVFTNRSNRNDRMLIMQKLKKQWTTIVLNLIAFLVIAWVINWLIDYAAYQTCLYAKLQANRIISERASEWALILFFKNISVIPFTLVFNALFLLWISNKLTKQIV